MPDMNDDTDTLTDAYVDLWMEADPELRRKAISELWAYDGAHVLLDPPMIIRESAAAIGFRAPALEVRGFAGLEQRVARTYEELIAPGQFQFRSRKNASRLGNVVTFNWEMVAVASDEIAGVGLDILVLDDEGRIRVDYQLIEA